MPLIEPELDEAIEIVRRGRKILGASRSHHVGRKKYRQESHMLAIQGSNRLIVLDSTPYQWRIQCEKATTIAAIS
jgi:hypothetical protein